MESSVLPPSTVELNLLLEWPNQRTRPQWAAIFGASLGLHVVLFVLATKVPSLIGSRTPEQPVSVRSVRLYLPRDLMTQKAPNQQKPSKQIEVADLTERRGSIPHRRFTMPKEEMAGKETARNMPQAPQITMEQNRAVPAGVPGGLPVPAPPPPSPTPGPFQNIGEPKPPAVHPGLVPPKVGFDTAGQHIAISDDAPDQPDEAPAQHAAVELQSDPSGADFKAYLKTILGIVRTNWRRVIPESARMGMLRGRTVVEFAIDRNGGIPKLVMADSSGSEPLDRAAVAGLSMSNPLPPLPGDFKGFQVRLAFTFAYNMPTR